VGSLFRQSLVARRQQSHCFSAETVMEFEPDQFQQMAGLVCYYGCSKFHYLHVSHDETLGKYVRVLSALPDAPVADVMTAPTPIEAGKPVGLRVEVDEERLCFAFRVGDGPWQPLRQIFDASILSDEAQRPGTPNFTGAFVGLACQDLSGADRHADFDYFFYRERDFRAHPFPDLADGF
jgi:xylan 1,4-beta-xylosidase